MSYFNKIYRFLWLFLAVLIMYISFQRNIKSEDGQQEVVSAFTSSPILSTITIIFIILLTALSVLRALEARNQWRKIADEDNVNQVFDNMEKKEK